MSPINEKFPLVSVLIPILNEEKHIKSCLENILNQNYPLDKIEVYIIDGDSRDRSIEIIKQFIKDHPSFKLILLKDIGKSISAAMNIGLKNAKGEVVIKADAHTKYETDYIFKCVEFLEKTRAECVGGPIRPMGINYKTGAISFALKTSFGSGGGKFHEDTYAGYTDAVYLGAFRKEFLKNIGGWNEKVLDEDEDLFLRIKKNGGKIYLTPKIKSYYYVYPTFKKLWEVYYEYGYSKVFFMRKHRILGAWHHIIPSLFVSSLFGTFLLGFFYKPFFILFFLILASYLIALFLITLKISLKKGVKYLPILPLIFIAIHFSYGFGFLKGILKIIISKNEQ